MVSSDRLASTTNNNNPTQPEEVTVDITTLTTREIDTIIGSALMDQDVSDLVAELRARADRGGDVLAENWMQRYRNEI